MDSGDSPNQAPASPTEEFEEGVEMQRRQDEEGRVQAEHAQELGDTEWSGNYENNEQNYGSMGNYEANHSATGANEDIIVLEDDSPRNQSNEGDGQEQVYESVGVGEYNPENVYQHADDDDDVQPVEDSITRQQDVIELGDDESRDVEETGEKLTAVDEQAQEQEDDNDEQAEGKEERFEKKESELQNIPDEAGMSPIGRSQHKRRTIIDSDDEDDHQPVEEPTPDSQEDHLKVEQPESSRIQAMNDDDEEDDDAIVLHKRKTIVDDDEKEEGERSRSASPVEGTSSKKRNLIGSDLSDNSDDEKATKRAQEEVGELMANIFGEDSDDEEEPQRKEEEGEQAGLEDEEEIEGDRRREDREESDFQWDFDEMMRRKKAERSRHRRRRKDGGIDIINDDDGTISKMVETMRAAAKDDRTSNIERRPALRKRKMLSEVKAMLIRADLVETMMDNGMLSAVSEWLAPLPDKSLPALEIRTTLLKIMQGFIRLETSILKQSGIGKAVMLLYKHPRETKENKEMAAQLIREWSRPIFQLDTDFRSLTKEERLERDLEHMPAAKRRRLSVDDEGNTTSMSTPKTPGGPTDSPVAGPGSSQQTLGPRDKGFVNRARVPRPSTKDYVIRPKSTIEGEFKGERKSKANARIDKATRDFKERTKKNKTQRAVAVSLEGRNLAL